MRLYEVEFMRGIQGTRYKKTSTTQIIFFYSKSRRQNTGEEIANPPTWVHICVIRLNKRISEVDWSYQTTIK